MLIAAEATAASNLSVDTIPYYEWAGMLPLVARGPDRHRRFSREDVDRCEALLAYKLAAYDEVEQRRRTA